jgi:N-acetylneuraminic acid mutarotase
MPTISNFSLIVKSGEGPFSGTITGLRGGNVYYIRAYAKNSSGQIDYGQQLSITTPPVFTTMAAFAGSTRLPNSVASFTIGNIAYLLGGDKGTEYTNELWAYNVSDRWDPVLSFPDLARKWQTPVVINDMAYVFGGIDNTNTTTNQMYRYQPNSNSWSYVTTLLGGPDPLYAAAGASLSNSAYFIGGCRDTIHAEVWMFNSYSSGWERKADFPVAQYGGMAVTIDNVVYAGFGLTNLSGSSSNRRLWTSFGSFNTWLEETTLPAEVGRVRTSVAYKGDIYIVDNNGAIWKYDLSDREWTQKSTLPNSNKGDCQHCMFVLNDGLYIGLGINYKSLLKYDPDWDY